MKRLVTFVLGLIVTSCWSGRPSVDSQPIETPIGTIYPAAETLEQSNKRLDSQHKAEEQRKADFAKTHTKYRIDQIPALNTKTVRMPLDNNFCIDASKLQPVILQKGILVRMRLGKGIHVGDNSYTFRTETRYILEVAGIEKCRAESLIRRDSSGNGAGQSQIFFNEVTSEVLIQEEIGGAGSQYRHIAFTPDKNLGVSKNGSSAKWRQVYVQVPGRVSVGSEGEHIGTVHGISGGKIYVAIDGAFYAFPVDDFVMEKLEFSVG